MTLVQVLLTAAVVLIIVIALRSRRSYRTRAAKKLAFYYWPRLDRGNPVPVAHYRRWRPSSASAGDPIWCSIPSVLLLLYTKPGLLSPIPGHRCAGHLIDKSPGAGPDEGRFAVARPCA